MKTVNLKLYTFDELSEDAKKKYIENHWEHNVEYYEWWDAIYDDAKNVGIKITEFDTYKRNISLEFINGPHDTAERILAEHGDSCDTYIAAKDFLDLVNKLYEQEDDVCDGDIEEFKKELGECYLMMLIKEYEDLTSYDAIEDALITNEYTFLKDGTMFNYTDGEEDEL